MANEPDLGAPANITQFEEVASQVLAKGYRTFPSAAPINIYKFSNVPEPGSGQPPPDEAKFVRDAVIWLSDAGFIKLQYQSKHSDRFHIVLTAKAYEILRGAPFPPSSTKSLGESVVEFAEAGAKEGAVEARRMIISEVMRWAIKLAAGGG